MTKKQLADAIDVQRDTVSRIERGKRRTSFNTLDRLAHFFNVNPLDLLGTTDEQAIASIPTILDRIDEYQPYLAQIIKLAHQIQDFFPRQLDNLHDQLEAIFAYFSPYTQLMKTVYQRWRRIIGWSKSLLVIRIFR